MAENTNIDGSPDRCTICPRGCGADRAAGPSGYCNTDDGFAVVSICLHRGEEPVLSGERGVCNIFFSHCNLQCVYCQNGQISRNSSPVRAMGLDDIICSVAHFLDSGAGTVGFVSPSHSIPQMRKIIQAIRDRGRRPVFVMNTGAFDRKETIEALEREIDVYLPDFKYSDEGLAAEYSGARGYPGVALRALREMYRQKGPDLALGADGTVKSGLIIRHLVLPGHVENSIECLRLIAEELSPSVYVSLMAQYHPVEAVEHHPVLGRTVTAAEYEAVLEEFYRLGFHRGWTQMPGSESHYLPDFEKEDPFG